MLTNLLLGQTAEEKNFIEDLFSVHLYTGNGSTQTITNGIDLAGKGGMVWIKSRNSPDGTTPYHVVGDSTMNLANGVLATNSNGPQGESFVGTAGLSGFTTSGFSINGGYYRDNAAVGQYASWTFRKAPKFFDVVTYTGNGTAGRTISHSLGVTPGMIIVKSTSGVSNWNVYHRSLTSGGTAENSVIYLNLTNQSGTAPTFWNNTAPTSTVFTLGDSVTTNGNGISYVAYLFAHDTTADGVIQCGSFTTDGVGKATVTTGWEPQFLIAKRTNATSGWYVDDTMRSMALTRYSYLEANTSSAETSGSGAYIFAPTSTGFAVDGLNGSSTYIYLAIRRGPMRTPTDATKVFYPFTTTTNSTIPSVTTSTIGFQSVDLWFNSAISGTYGASVNYSNRLSTRLTGFGTSTSKALVTSATSAEADYGYSSISDGGLTYTTPATSWGTTKFAWYFLRRAPGFFDVVCYTGTGSARTVSHNLGVAPELMIVKSRNRTGAYVTGWFVFAAPLGATGGLTLNSQNQFVTTSTWWNNTSPTNSVFTVGTNDGVNASVNGNQYVAYLFATCPGVSKVGSYTGTGTTNQINCGFTNGARFVLIKRTDSTGDWYVWDTARGVVSGNDPYLLLNSTAAEVTNTDYIDPLSTGFEISSTAPAAINANGGTFIYLAIA